MNFPQFWAQGRKGSFVIWRWSFQSLAEAQALANRAVEELAARFAQGGALEKHGGYYPNRPFREQVLQQIKDKTGQVAAVITRNSYGCKVLNTARLMFVDIDLPKPPKPGGFWQKLFGRPAAAAIDPAQVALLRVENWTRSHSEWGWRVYRTFAGLRLMATHAPMDPESLETNEVFASLGADPLYQTLCRTQKCFRARLTPKPWRCGHHQNVHRWPWANDTEKDWFQDWEEHYLRKSEAFATCELVRTLGNPSVDPLIEPLIKMHDSPTKAESKLPLA